MWIFQITVVPRALAGRLASVCFDMLADVARPIAVRVFAMTVLVNLCAGRKRDAKLQEEGGVLVPKLAREVELAITTVLPYGTAAFTSRAKKELKRLETARDMKSPAARAVRIRNDSERA